MSNNKKKQNNPDKKIYAAERQTGGYIEDQYKKTSSVTLANILAMREEPTIKIGIWFYNTILKGGLSDYIHPNDEIQQFVRENLERIQLKEKLNKILSYHWVGASISEMVWEYLDTKWQFTDLIYLRPESWYSKGLPLKEKDPIIQVVSGMFENNIPRNKCLIIRNSDDYEESSILDGTVYVHWDRKRKTYMDWSNALEQYAKPKTRVIYQQGSGLYGPDGTPMDEKKEAEFYAQKAEEFRTATSYAHDDGLQVEAVAAPAGMGSNFLDKLTYDDAMILRSMLLPPLLAQGSDGGAGSRAMGETHYKIFWDYIQSEMERVSTTLCSQLIRPLIDYNFDGVTDYGHFNVDDVGTKDYSMWKDIFIGLTNMGVLSPSVNKTHRKKMLEFFNLLDGMTDVTEMLNNSIIPQEELEK